MMYVLFWCLFEAKDEIRSIRRKYLDEVKAVKSSISVDDARRMEKDIQSQHDDKIKMIDKVGKEKQERVLNG